ncbi:phosphoribosyl-AMP cyclohydrolase [Inquilinus sp. CAU 1745]|uniref:phosphoribosyl-AMP cyclohydrolase n=1 Tax=Inquilinus sp. CAU 1745 TaxID=3140369 RepID=UPI00325AE60A
MIPAAPVPALPSALLEALAFDEKGLIPAIAQQHDTGEVLMVAWMNREAIEETVATGRVCYWSRSRKALWRKGETSGQVQALVELRLDCDGDCLLLLVDQTGVACHTGRRSCFFRALRDGKLETIAEVVSDPGELYGRISPLTQPSPTRGEG